MAQGNELQRWADKAMFSAEEMPFDVNKDGPQVYLIGMTADPLGHIAAASKMYKGEVVRSLADVTFAERGHYLREILQTKLKAPFEFVKFHFMIEGVTRSFTHQMVRQRTAVYAQESLRFAVKENLDEEVALPPSLIGLPADHPQRVLWRQGLNRLDDVYNALIADGVPAEDARGLLPHNVTTRLHYSTDLRALQDHAGNRLCTQAQFEWRRVFPKMVDAIRNYKAHANWTAQLRDKNAPKKNLPQDIIEALDFLDAGESWQYEAIADIFRPVCYLTGKCEFNAEFDRPCSIRDRVEANHRIGRDSSEWHNEHDKVEGNPIVAGVGPKSVVSDNGRPVFIGAIQPHEWLTDPGAAR